MTNKEAIERLWKCEKLGIPLSIELDAFRMAIKALENQEWIPCKERLPEVDKEVEVRLSNGIEFQGFYDGYEWNIGDSNLMYLAIDLVDAFEDEELKVLSWRNKR